MPEVDYLQEMRVTDIDSEPMDEPRFPDSHPDYELDLEEAMEPALVVAIDAARIAGWSEDALWPALRSLVTNLEYAATENRITEADIIEARARLAKSN